MLLSFRQGIVQHEPSDFLLISPIAVSLIAVDTPTIVTLASGTKDYLHVERETVTNAWGPITQGVDQWLYWDINVTSGVRTFGITLRDPLFQPTEPTGVATDQHWFDTTQEVMKVWNGNRWVEKLRVFACKLSNGAVPISMSPGSSGFIGSQVGIVRTTYAGQIMFDSITGNALKAGNKFVTTEDVLSTPTLTKSDVKFASIVVPAESQQPMDAYTVVKFVDFGRVVYADAFIANQEIPYGIIQQPCIAGDTVTVLLEGAVSSVDWDWSSAGVNAPLFCTSSGQLSPTKQIPGQLPVAMVVDTKTIMLGAPRVVNTGDTIVSATTLDAMTDVTISAPAASQYLTYNGTQWVNSPFPTLVTSLDALTDVTLTTPSTNQYLRYDGAAWVNGTLPLTDLNALTDVVLTSPSSNQHLVYNGSAWVNSTMPTPVTDLDGLTDVTVTAPVADHYLKYDGSGWVNSALPTPITNLDALTDVVLTTPVTDHFLKYNGTQWVNAPVSAPTLYINDLADVTISGLATDHILKYSGTQWVNEAPPINYKNLNLYGPTGLPARTTGSYNAAYGQDSMLGMTTGYNNTAVGYSALTSLTSGNDNVAVGYEAMRSNTSGYLNVAVGSGAMYSHTTSGSNVAVGHQSLYSTTTGSLNVAVGRRTLWTNTTGNLNVAIGHQSSYANTTGFANVGVGLETLRYNLDGHSNIGIGTSALFTNVSGVENTVVGTSAMYYLNGGNGNTVIGMGAGQNNVTGSNNIFIGYNAGSGELGSNKLYIANSNTATPLIYGDFSTSTLTINGRMRAKTAYSDVTVLSIAAGSVAVDASLSNNFELTANGNFTLNNPTNLVKGMVINFELIQDGVGSRVITYGSMYKFAVDVDKTLSTTPNARDFMSCYYNGTNLLCTLGKRYQ